MSYARFSEGDVYVWEGVYESGAGYITCQLCCLMRDADDFTVARRSHMVTHLEHHRERGHLVPQRALDELEWDIQVLGDEALSAEAWEHLGAAGDGDPQ